MSQLLTIPDRLCLMLKDCDPDVVAAYHTHQDSLDYVERPCWIVTMGDASYDAGESSSEQAAVNESYTLDFVGEPFTGTEEDYNAFYELQARRIAHNSVLYFLRHPNLQCSNQRGLLDAKLPALAGIWWARPTSRSAVTLMTRGSNDEGFWGFSISLEIRSMFLVDESEIIVG